MAALIIARIVARRSRNGTMTPRSTAYVLGGAVFLLVVSALFIRAFLLPCAGAVLALCIALGPSLLRRYLTINGAEAAGPAQAGQEGQTP